MENNYQDEVAKILIDIESVKFSFKSPFILTSGHKSPVYVDCRKIISVALRTFSTSAAQDEISGKIRKFHNWVHIHSVKIKIFNFLPMENYDPRQIDVKRLPHKSSSRGHPCPAGVI